MSNSVTKVELFYFILTLFFNAFIHTITCRMSIYTYCMYEVNKQVKWLCDTHKKSCLLLSVFEFLIMIIFLYKDSPVLF